MRKSGWVCLRAFIHKQKTRPQSLIAAKAAPVVSVPVSSTTTSYDVFELCVQRASSLIKLHKVAHGKAGKPEKYTSDAHRAAIVLAISALDAFIRTFVILKVRQIFTRRNSPLPDSLVDQVKKFLKFEDVLEAARKDDLLERVQKALYSDFGRRSFQGTRNIEDYLKIIGYEDVFREVARRAKINEASLRSELDRFTNRRHLIAHHGDYDLQQNPPLENLITKKDAEECIRLVRCIAKHMHALEAQQ